MMAESRAVRSVVCDECGIDMRPNLAIGKLGGKHRQGCSRTGTMLVTTDDPRYCPWARADKEHPPHDFYYEYDRPEKHGGHTFGHSVCDGVPMHPYPSVTALPDQSRPLRPGAKT